MTGDSSRTAGWSVMDMGYGGILEMDNVGVFFVVFGSVTRRFEMSQSEVYVHDVS
jgi:hypothetical protein